ncbi:hypothetical protein GGF42_006867 [Coemansia sp. RSA 2424]|nr:hypothetical protein GGF42_006867 [Coemansia sp. RSA 2424]
MLVVHKVVEYLEGKPRNSFGTDMAEHNNRKAVLVPLLSVSERWRMAALESICDNCTLDFEYDRKAVEITYPAWPVDFSYPRFHRNQLVKRVVVATSLWSDLREGKFCDVINRPQYENLVFLSARSLFILLSSSSVNSPSSANSRYMSNDFTSAAIQERAASIACSLLQLAPSAVSITVSLLASQRQYRDSGRQHERQPDLESLYGKITSELCRGSGRRLQVISKVDNFLYSLDFRTISGLTSISHGLNLACTPFARLAYLNAQTLKALDIRIAGAGDWSTLVCGATTTSATYTGFASLKLHIADVSYTTTPAAYTSLTSLKLHIADVSYTTTWAAIDDIQVFPVLSALDVSGGYPFDDDLLFRGNGGAMRCLRLPFCAIARNALGRFNVLKRSGVVRMDRVCIDEATGADNTFIFGRANSPVRQQVHDILDVATVLKAKYVRGNFPIYYTLHAARTAIIRYLDFDDELIAVGGIIDLVSALPCLVSLTCGVAKLDIATKAIPAIDRPSRLRTKHYPLSTNFKRLHITCEANNLAEYAASTAMYLAILCPNFAHVDLPFNKRRAFSREIAWASCNPPFDAYADTIRRLIFNELVGED